MKHSTLCLAIALILVAPVHAQEAKSVYQDNLLDPSVVKQLDEEEGVEEYNPEGRLRQINIEGVYGKSSYSSSDNERSQTEYGLAFDGFLETDNHGVFSIDGVFAKTNGQVTRVGRDGWSRRITVWQRNWYLPNNWRMDNGFGVLQTPSSDLMRNQYRFFFPTTAMEGVSLSAINDHGWKFQSSYGQAGYYSGSRLAGFERGEGHVTTTSVHKNINEHWSAGISTLSTRGQLLNNIIDTSFFPQPSSSDAVHAAVQWKQGQQQFQVNALTSRGNLTFQNQQQRVNAQGVWFDGQYASDVSRTTHNYGAFYFEPDLLWGALPINADAKGGYYRISHQRGRWNWNVGMDHIQSISGESFEGQYITSFGRYQYNSLMGFGGNLNVRRGDSDAHSANLFMDRKNSWGQSRVQIDQASSLEDDSWQVTLDQTWPTREGTNFSTAVSYGELSYNGQPSNTWTVSTNGSLPLGRKASIDGTARVYRSDGMSAFHGNDINVAFNYHFTPRLTGIVSAFQSRGYVRSPFIVDPLFQDDIYQRSSDRSVFVSLRYNYAAGSRTPVLGAPSVGHTASGTIEGRVFLDENNDGAFNASEEGVSNVLVVLDGRYSVQTDASGRYVFDRVSVGTHHIQVVSDALPLPWSVSNEPHMIDVEVRQTSQWDIPAVRP